MVARLSHQQIVQVRVLMATFGHLDNYVIIQMLVFQWLEYRSDKPKTDFRLVPSILTLLRWLKNHVSAISPVVGYLTVYEETPFRLGYGTLIDPLMLL